MDILTGIIVGAILAAIIATSFYWIGRFAERREWQRHFENWSDRE